MNRRQELATRTLERILELEAKVDKASKCTLGASRLNLYNFLCRTYEVNIWLYNTVSKQKYSPKFWVKK
mgnify:CR=1 FL=1